MTNPIRNPKSEIRNAARFPLGICVASIATTSLGLIAAAGGMKWGAAPAPGDALREAWVYVQVMATLAWLVVWPALSRAKAWRGLLWEWAALVMGAVPAMAVAAQLARARGMMAGVLLQVAFGLCALWILAAALRWRPLAMVLPIAGLALPVVGYLLWDLFSVGSGLGVIPVVAAARIATMNASGVMFLCFGYICAGAAVLAVACVFPRHATATTG